MLVSSGCDEKRNYAREDGVVLSKKCLDKQRLGGMGNIFPFKSLKTCECEN